MKFKTASILGLIIPLTIALMLTAFLGCGGGGSPYGNSQAYDGTWSLNLKGYTLPGPAAPGLVVSCSEEYTNIVIAHGYGTTTEILDCTNAASPNYAIDIGVTLTPDPTGTTGTVKLETTGGGGPATGTCIDRVTCTATGLLMIKCGEAASGC